MAFNLLKSDNRWDSIFEWYKCVGSVTLLEFICAAHHRQGHTAKRDMVKKLIESPDLNANNKRNTKLEIKNVKKLEFCRKLWRLYS